MKRQKIRYRVTLHFVSLNREECKKEYENIKFGELSTVVKKAVRRGHFVLRSGDYCVFDISIDIEGIIYK